MAKANRPGRGEGRSMAMPFPAPPPGRDPFLHTPVADATGYTRSSLRDYGFHAPHLITPPVRGAARFLSIYGAGARFMLVVKAAVSPISNTLPLIMKKGMLTPGQIASYSRDGFIIARKFFDRQEIDLLSRAAHEDRVLDEHSFSRDDGTGATVRLSLWNHPGDGIYGMFARCHKLVESVEQLLDDEAYHYHSKMIMKDARIGGAWAWHQDYGYWYQNGVLTPNLCSVSIAVDAATMENGCLQVLKGSHAMGRVDHVLSGDQAGADLERVQEAMKRYELVYCVMKPGDALFFHSNLLHASARNDSDKPRWSMICCYNAKGNDPYKKAHHPRYTPLKKVPDAMIKKTGSKRFVNDGSNVAFLEVKKDASAASLKKKPAAN